MVLLATSVGFERRKSFKHRVPYAAYALTENSGLISSQKSISMQNDKITNFGAVFWYFPLNYVYKTVRNLIRIDQRFLKSYKTFKLACE